MNVKKQLGEKEDSLIKFEGIFLVLHLIVIKVMVQKALLPNMLS